MNLDVMFSSKSMEWATPQDFFDRLNDEFHFTLDPCADDHNHKCDTYYTEKENGLEQCWGGADRILQSTIRKSNKRLGEEMLRRIQKAWYNRCHVNTGSNGYKLLPRLHLSKAKC